MLLSPDCLRRATTVRRLAVWGTMQTVVREFSHRIRKRHIGQRNPFDVLRLGSRLAHKPVLADDGGDNIRVDAQSRGDLWAGPLRLPQAADFRVALLPVELT